MENAGAAERKNPARRQIKGGTETGPFPGSPGKKPAGNNWEKKCTANGENPKCVTEPPKTAVPACNFHTETDSDQNRLIPDEVRSQ